MYILKYFDILSPLSVSKMKEVKDTFFSSFDLLIFTCMWPNKKLSIYFITFERVYM